MRCYFLYGFLHNVSLQCSANRIGLFSACFWHSELYVCHWPQGINLGITRPSFSFFFFSFFSLSFSFLPFLSFAFFSSLPFLLWRYERSHLHFRDGEAGFYGMGPERDLLGLHDETCDGSFGITSKIMTWDASLTQEGELVALCNVLRM